MIQSAAPSISSSLALGVGAQAAPGEDAALSADFAALLQSTLVPGQVELTDQAPVLDPATNPLMRQAPGNAAGKKLPLDLLLADAALAEAAQAADDAASDTPVDTDAAAPLTTLATDIILPGLVVPVSLPAPEAPKAAAAPSSATRSTMDSLAQTAAAQAIRPKLPEAAGTDAKAAPVLPGTAANTPDSAATATPIVQTIPFQLPSQSEDAANAAARFGDNAAVTLTAATPASAQAAVSVAIPLLRTPGHAASVRHGESKPAAMQTPSADAKAAPTEISDTQRTAAPQPSAVMPSLLRDAEAASARTSAAAKLAADTPSAPGLSQAAPVAQPIVGMDAQSFAQTLAPVTTSPATGSIAQTGHDFAALVDRLVEARQFAVPEAVHAAITHSDFGQVSLRFDQDANGLSVSMTSADPEFANAVQATAASSQSQTTSDNGSNSSRQDGQSQQHAAGSASGQSQSQSQSQSQASARNERNAQAETRFGRGSSPQTQADEPADTRGGIYA